MGKQWEQWETLFSLTAKSLLMVTTAMKLGLLLLGRKPITNLDSMLKSRDTLPTKVHLVKAMVFPVIMYGCESWTIKKAERQRIDAFELWCLNYKEIKLVHPKGNQLWIRTGRSDAEADTPILWPHDAKSRLTGKVPDAGNDWKREERGMTEDEMVGWYHQLNAYEFEKILGDDEGWGGLACCSPWGHKEWDLTDHWSATKGSQLGLRSEVLSHFKCKICSPGQSPQRDRWGNILREGGS